MDRQAAARKLVGDLVKAEQIEVRRAEVVARDLAKLIDTLDRPPTVRELEDWLSDHQQVDEVYATTAMLEEVLARYFAPPRVEVQGAPSNPELVRQLRDDPTNVAPYLVYSDWLQEQGDPLGELIALGIAVTNNEGDEAIARFERHLKTHDAQLFGGIPRVRERAGLHWHNGMVSSINDGGAAPLEAKEWERLLQLRICALVHTLSFGSMARCTSALDEAVATAAPESLAELYWRDAWPVHTMRRKLRVLGISGRVTPTEAVPLDTIDTLRLEIGAFSLADPVLKRIPVRALELHWCVPGILAGFAETEFPHLEQLTISLTHCRVDDVASLLLRNEIPALRHLTLSNGLIHPSAFTALAKTPPAARLSSLALERVELDDAGALAILPALRTLAITKLDVSGNELTASGLAALRAVVPNVIAERQGQPGDGRQRRIRWFAGSRLEAAEEIVDMAAWDVTTDGDRHSATYSDYELFVTDDLTEYNCTCPSRAQPCKHVVALAMITTRKK